MRALDDQPVVDAHTVLLGEQPFEGLPRTGAEAQLVERQHFGDLIFGDRHAVDIDLGRVARGEINDDIALEQRGALSDWRNLLDRDRKISRSGVTEVDDNSGAEQRSGEGKGSDDDEPVGAGGGKVHASKGTASEV